MPAGRPSLYPITKFSDDDLLTELQWRGYRFIKDNKQIYESKYPERIQDMSGRQFISFLNDKYKTNIREGGTKMRVLDCLLTAFPDYARHEQIEHYCYGHFINGGPEDARNCIRVFISDLRKGLTNTPFNIKSIFGEGFVLEMEETNND